MNVNHSQPPSRSRAAIRAFLGLAILALASACANSETVKPTTPTRKPFRVAESTPMRPSVTDEAPDWTPSPQPQTPVKPPPPPPALRDLKGLKIVVDAGHGGKDPGKPKGPGSADEKVIVLDLANKLASELRARGAAVTMTRTKDVFIELEARAAIAEKSRADLFVSVHADAHDNPTISGATVYVARNAGSASKKIASAIERSLKQAGTQVRGVRSANFVVLVKHSRPAVLIESGYLTNAVDRKNLNDAAYRTRLAKTFADGIQAGLRGG